MVTLCLCVGKQIAFLAFCLVLEVRHIVVWGTSSVVQGCALHGGQPRQ